LSGATNRGVWCVARAWLAADRSGTVGSVILSAVGTPVGAIADFESEGVGFVGGVGRVASLEIAHCAPQAVVVAAAETLGHPVTVVWIRVVTAVSVEQVVVLAGARVVDRLLLHVVVVRGVAVGVWLAVDALVVGVVCVVALCVDVHSSVVVVAVEVGGRGGVG